jgi:hypothetical protein
MVETGRPRLQHGQERSAGAVGVCSPQFRRPHSFCLARAARALSNFWPAARIAAAPYLLSRAKNSRLERRHLPKMEIASVKGTNLHKLVPILDRHMPSRKSTLPVARSC